MAATWLRLFRWKNLLFLALLQCAAWLFSVMPWEPYYITFTGPLPFLAICFSTACIAAAGYLINDWYDRDTDSVNREHPVLLRSGLSKRQVWGMYFLLNAVGLVLAALVAASAARPYWVLFQLGVVLLLWFYSYELKRRVLYGNVLVALLSSLSLLMLLLYEPNIRDYDLIPAFKCLPPLFVIGALSVHAFWTTLMRELVKDLEDEPGDEEAGCTTFPIVYGRAQSIRLLLFYGVGFTLSLLLMIGYLVQEHFWITAAYLLFIIAGYTVTIVRPVMAAHTPAEWKMVSARVKLLMMLGCGGLLIYYIELCLPSY